MFMTQCAIMDDGHCDCHNRVQTPSMDAPDKTLQRRRKEKKNIEKPSRRPALQGPRSPTCILGSPRGDGRSQVHPDLSRIHCDAPLLPGPRHKFSTFKQLHADASADASADACSNHSDPAHFRNSIPGAGNRLNFTYFTSFGSGLGHGSFLTIDAI